MFLTVAGCEDLRRSGLCNQGIDDVEETLIGSVLRVLADRDKGNRHTSSEPNGVLNVQVCALS